MTHVNTWQKWFTSSDYLNPKIKFWNSINRKPRHSFSGMNSHHTKTLKLWNSKAPKQIPKDQESSLRSSSTQPSRSSPNGPLKELPPIQDQAPTALEESVHRSSFVHPKIKPQRPFGSITSTNPHIQPFFKIKPKSPWRSIHQLFIKIKPQRPLKIRSSTVLQDQAQKPWRSVHPSTFKIKPKGPWRNFPQPSRLSPNGPWINSTIHKFTHYEDRIRG